MRYCIPVSRFVIALSISASFAAGSALANDAEVRAEQASIGGKQATQDDLFSQLKRERDAGKAREIANRIRLGWQESGSPTVNLIMQWTAKAVEADDKARALDLLDQAIYLAPDYAEGWNQRATLHYQMGNYRKSMSDINHVLALEPRHFGALAGMAAMLSSTGRDELALRAWEQFLEIYPTDRRAQEQVGELSEKLAGSRT